jgi:hypothetical protein
MGVDEEAVARKFAALAPVWTSGSGACGWGWRRARPAMGASARWRAAGVLRPTVAKAVGEIDEPDEALPPGRVRRPGGGRKPAVEADPELAEAVEALVDLVSRGDPESPLRWTSKSTLELAEAVEALVDLVSRGDPESPLRWTSKSTLELAEALGDTEHEASHTLVGRLLRRLGYSLQAMAKTAESTQHPDRDAQFRYLTEQVNAYLAAAQAVVSVDTKKKELVGDYKNAGREWQPTGEPEPANVPDFPDPDVGKALPYGVYDVGADVGWVSVRTDHDTSAFAVQTLRPW